MKSVEIWLPRRQEARFDPSTIPYRFSPAARVKIELRRAREVKTPAAVLEPVLAALRTELVADVVAAAEVLQIPVGRAAEGVWLCIEEPDHEEAWVRPFSGQENAPIASGVRERPDLRSQGRPRPYSRRCAC